MDRHSEIEVKFNADKVPTREFHRFIHGIIKPGYEVERYKVARGADTYYRINGAILRYRNDGGGGCLTYKERKSVESIMDRVEIDLPFPESVKPRDVKEVMKYLKAEELFTIDKVSYIYHCKGVVTQDGVSQKYEATIAMYDVETTKKDIPLRRFLEVEIERHNKCSPEAAVTALRWWTEIIMKQLDLNDPLNQSLFEIYADS